jgi:polysaccharide biosynthesis PFTS motif protein
MKSTHFESNIKFYIPPKWWKFFESSDIQVNRLACLFLWAKFSFKQVFFEYLKLCRSIKIYLNSIDIPLENNSSLTLHCNEENFQVRANKDLFNFGNWLKSQTKNLGINKHYFLIPSNNNESFDKNYISLSEHAIFSNTILGISMACFNLFRLSKFKMTFLLRFMANPNSFFKYLSLDNRKIKFIKYIFVPSSGSWVKPLWLSQAENYGVKVVYVNLSADLVPWQKNQPPYFNWYHLSAWKNIWSTCKVQNDQFIQFSPRFIVADHKIVGVPDWLDLDEDLELEKEFISIFDIEPHQLNFGQTSLNDFHYADISNTIKFLTDLAEVSSKLGITCIHKPKRAIGRRRYQDYSDSIHFLQNQHEGFRTVNESIAPRRLVNLSKCVISMPFTSTAFIAEQLGVVNCFYDPSGLIDLTDEAGQGILIINNKEHLCSWLSSLIQADN